VALHSEIHFRLGIAFLLALAGLPARAQIAINQPSIKMTVSPEIVEPGQDLTFTISVASTQRFKAALWNPIPGLTRFVSVQHSGSNLPADKCTEHTGLSPYNNLIPGVSSRGSSVLCEIPFPGTETITLVVTALNPGIVTNTAALIWETNTNPPHTEHITASASAAIDAAVPIFANFGLGLPCLTAGFCIQPNSLSVNGANSTVNIPPPANTMAVSFTPAATLRLSDIQIPFAAEPGSPNDFFVWIAADSNGFPGTVLEKFHITNFPPPVAQSPFVTVTLLGSVVQPTLAAGKLFWLVIGPGDPKVFGAWSLAQSDTATPTNFLLSATTSVGVMPLAASDWRSASPSFPLRLAFEIDGKP
jgi:hypothetical protein